MLNESGSQSLNTLGGDTTTSKVRGSADPRTSCRRIGNAESHEIGKYQPAGTSAGCAHSSGYPPKSASHPTEITALPVAKFIGRPGTGGFRDGLGTTTRTLRPTPAPPPGFGQPCIRGSLQSPAISTMPSPESPAYRGQEYPLATCWGH